MFEKTALLVQQGFPNYGVLDFHYCPHKTVFTGCTELPPFCAVCVCALTRVGGQSPMYMCPAQYAVQLPCWSKSRCVGATSAVGRRSCKKELWVASGQYCFKMVAVACGPASKHGHGNESFWHRRTTQLPQASKADCNKAWILRLLLYLHCILIFMR